jgi:hypothetical protein
MAIKPLLSMALIGDPSAAIEAARRIAQRLNQHSGTNPSVGARSCPEKAWYSAAGIRISKTYLIDAALLLGL